MDYRIISTDDGSNTVENTTIGDTFHSRFGAVSESRYIFIRHGLNYFHDRNDQLSILEVGMGTGLNVFLTCLESQEGGGNIYYMAVEPDPMPPAIYLNLNYPGILSDDKGRKIFEGIHECEEEKDVSLIPSFKFKKVHCTIEAAALPANYFDLVYFDAFGPVFQPEVWKVDVFRKIFVSMRAGGILVTFSSMGQVRRSLAEAGFTTEKLPGPKGKREITRACKKN